MNQPIVMSSTVRAGRLLRLLGWLTLIFVVTVGASIAIPTIVRGDPFPQEAILGLVVAFLVVVAYFVVGDGVKKYRPWAKIAGVVVSLLSLASVPIGTVIGAIILFYLIRGWREQPGVA